MSSSGGSRVSIPADLLKTIQNIRDLTGIQHSDEDILSVYNDCLNDLHETAQKLMYLDTFQEVKSKRERKKENVVPKAQERGRYGRKNFALRYTDANNGRSAAFKKQTGPNQVIGGSRTASPAPNKAINATPTSIKAPTTVSPPSGVTEENPLAKSTSLSEDVVALEKSKATVVTVSDVPVAVPVSDSTSSAQSTQVTRTEAAANKGKNQSPLSSEFGERPHVTFPVHLQAAKLVENGLKFGSFGSGAVKEASLDNCTNECNDSSVESSHGTVADVASARDDISTVSEDKDHEIANSAPKVELAMQSDETLHPVEGSVGDKLIEEVTPVTDTTQAANSDGAPISYPDHSVAASQQAMHLLRQQYPPNYFPYGPYFPPFYMPQGPQPYMHQYLNPNGFQQSYLPPGDDASTTQGPKLSLPHIIPGSTIGNSPATTIPSPYDSYMAAFNHVASAPTMNSADIEEKKENIYTNEQLRLANLQASAMYNFPLQRQPLAFPTPVQAGFAGIYQQTQPAPAISAMTEPIGLPRVTNQQPEAALTNLGNNYLVKQSN